MSQLQLYEVNSLWLGGLHIITLLNWYSLNKCILIEIDLINKSYLEYMINENQ